MVVVSLLLVSALVATAPSDDGVEHDEDFVTAERLRAEFRYDEAIGYYENALAKPERTDEERARLLVSIGTIHANLVRDPAALSAFERALAADPAATVADDAAPHVKELFEKARGRALAADATSPEPPSDGGATPPRATWPMTVALVGGGVSAIGALTLAGGVGTFFYADSMRFQDDVARAGTVGVVLQAGGAGLFVVGLALAGTGLALDVVQP